MAKKQRGEPKKAVVFIVEGSSDKKVLEKIVQKIYNKKDIVFKFMGVLQVMRMSISRMWKIDNLP